MSEAKKELYVVTEKRVEAKYYSNQIEAIEDYHSRYHNGSREFSEYIMCDIEKVRKAIDELKAVLLDPQGNCSIDGSIVDKITIEASIRILKTLEPA